MEPPRQDDDADRQLARVEGLLATVDHVLAALARSNASIRTEVRMLALEARDRRHAELALALQALRAENEQLREAMAGRAPIEQAKGILSVRWGCAPEDAFEGLAELSRVRGRKVRELAREVVATGGQGWVPPGRNRVAG